MATAVVNLAEEIVGGVLQHAEQLRGAVVAADNGVVESLRWAGALPLLLRDLRVPRIVSTQTVWHAANESGDALVALLQPPCMWQPEPASGVDVDRDEPPVFIDHLVLMLSGFLWEYEPRLQQLVARGVVRRLTVCSSLSERAHECYDFGAGNASQKMAFDGFAATLAAHHAFQPREIEAQKTPPQPTVSSPRSPRKRATSGSDQPGDDWGWGDGDDDESESGDGDAQDHAAASSATATGALTRVEGEVVVIHVPLNHAPLLHAKGALSTSGEPSLFVLSHPICATAFPLLLTRVLRHQQRKQQYQQLHALSTSTTAVHGASGAMSLPVYSHVKEVLPEHIPTEFRRTLKLVAHVLGEILVQARLDAKERIYAMGNTSLKIGHTLLKILNELQGELTTHALQSHQAATIVLVDRTSDLVAPCSFGVSLLDRVLALLPQTPHDQPSSHAPQTNRTGLHITEIFPLHGCEPSPLSVSLPVDPAQVEQFAPSSFVGCVKWKGGASLCHPRAAHGLSVFRSLAFRPAKLALRDLDKRLQEIEKELLVQRKITRSGSSKKPGEKPPSTRGRDVVLRRMSNILEAGEPTNLEHSALIELGIIVLETLERMESVQQRWDTCRERAARHVKLRMQGAGEWIIPELADTVQRQFMASRNPTQKAGAPSSSSVSFHELLSLLVHAYSLTPGSPVEEHTLQMIRNVLSESVLETVQTDPKAVERLCPDLLADLLPFVGKCKASKSSFGQSSSPRPSSGGDEEDWDWNDGGQSPRGAKTQDDDDYSQLQAKGIVESHMDELLAPLKECAQLFAKQHDHEYRASLAAAGGDGAARPPRSLLAQMCESLTTPPMASIAELEHVVDASEQLTRAGIDLLKSGFSRFGFGGASGTTAGALAGGSGAMGESKILVIFVVGGVTFEEVQQVHEALEGNSEYQVIVGGTTITNSDILIEQLFR